MAKLTQKQVRDIERAIQNAEAAWNYVMRADIAVARKGGTATTTLHYTRPDGSVLYEVQREYGSQLCRLGTAITDLRNFLDVHSA